ncbi:AAA family ATPase [Xenorhabdus stockiae]|uniref:AAA family ATPase n=1 Tax=Xenorhabdus stockiae TaxID=351614 RepID=UPI003CED5D8D
MLSVTGSEIKIGNRKIISDFNCLFNTGLNHISGVNGSGKTTFLSCIAGVNRIRKGSVNFIEADKASPFNLQKQGFYLSEHVDSYHFLTGLDIINLTKKYKKLNEYHPLDYYLSGFGISNYLYTEFGNMSLGTKKKFLLVSALMTDMDVYIFDEPINGLDSSSVNFFRTLLNFLSERKIIIFSSHDEDLFKMVTYYQLSN